MKKKRVSLSGENKTLDEIWDWFELQARLSNAKKLEIRQQSQSNQLAPDSRFFGMTPEEIDLFFSELDKVTMLDLMAAAEAAIRVDYLTRVYYRRKDHVSRKLRELYKQAGERVKLEDGILEVWRNCKPGSKVVVSNFRAACNYRHWLAHGRYWSRRSAEATLLRTSLISPQTFSTS